MIVVVALGTVASLLFYLSVSDKDDYEAESDQDDKDYYEVLRGQDDIKDDLDEVQPLTPKDWLLEPHFYQIAGIYMLSRLFINISQEYIPLYLQVGTKQ